MDEFNSVVNYVRFIFNKRNILCYFCRAPLRIINKKFLWNKCKYIFIFGNSIGKKTVFFVLILLILKTLSLINGRPIIKALLFLFLQISSKTFLFKFYLFHKSGKIFYFQKYFNSFEGSKYLIPMFSHSLISFPN